MTPLAHLGGVPEVAFVALPLLLFALFVFLERRARRGGPPVDERANPDEPSQDGR